MIQDILKDALHRMDQAITHTRMELAKVRTGRANPELLEGLSIDYYGTMTPLNQLSSITVPDASLISIQPYDKTLIPEIEKIIMQSNLGLSPNNNGTSVLVPIPPLSEERRKDLIKHVHQLMEEGRIAVRNVRRDANHHLKSLQSEDHLSEDEIHRSEQEVQRYTDDHVKLLGDLQVTKEKELMEF
jgi:ribosome recycling factor|tara:strand:+ start:835 stop:1392 length:558 start_codon:yes stop_codon:yes gene_type:complete